jgi:glutamate dehydrogenase
MIKGSGLGLLQETKKTIRSRPITTFSDEARSNRDNPLIITKTGSRSNVHRVGYMDYIGVLRFDKNGRTLGERRFIGLFTSNAYFRRATDTPLVRLKVEEVLTNSALRENSHALKSLMHILETLPRDTLFQATVEDLTRVAIAVLNLQERHRVQLLIRRERFSRFFSCLVYIPRDQFNTENREKIQNILKRALKGEKLDYHVQVSDSVLARLQVIVRPRPGEDPDPDVKALENKIIRALRSWQDELSEILVQKHGEDRGLELAARIGKAFPAAYEEDVSPWVSSFDVEKIDALKNGDDLGMSLYKPRKKGTGIIRFKLFRANEPIPLSNVLPMLENMGLHIVSERPYELKMEDEKVVWVQDFDMLFEQGKELNLDTVRDNFQEAFDYTLRGITVSDGFNLCRGIACWLTCLLSCLTRASILSVTMTLNSKLNKHKNNCAKRPLPLQMPARAKTKCCMNTLRTWLKLEEEAGSCRSRPSAEPLFAVWPQSEASMKTGYCMLSTAC